MATDPDPLVGQVLLGLFRVTEVLGGGATGTVYRGWQMGMERDVAIKVLHQELSGDGDLRLRFFREARAVARLSHPNIVTVYLIDEMAGGQPFLVMEHVRGATLEDLLGDGEVMAPQRSLAIAGQIVSALAEAHAAGVVHRDLKPANILITNRRRVRDFVTVVDFGVAKLTGTEVPMAPGESQLTRQGAVFGTPAYLSPEQARGEAVDARADLYSVGVMLYRMATGRLPFAGEGLAVLLAHVNQPLPPPRVVYPAIDRDLEAVIVQCLDKDPAKRPQSAEALADALDAVEARMARPAPASPTQHGWPVGESSWRLTTEMPPVRGHLWGWWLVAAAVIAAAVTVGWRAWPRTHHETSAAMVDARPAADAPPVAAADGPRRAVIAAASGYSLRVLIPDPARAGTRVAIIIDAWDAAGVPIAAETLPVTIADAAGERREDAIAGQMPGRFTVAMTLSPGDVALGVAMPEPGTTVTVYFTVASASG